ncbi:MAG: NAD-dependent epimerase/dehydratase family protein [Anaerolineae bacterium]|nr:NAD-dependent epimerase/dehydratase family protein [Gemmatimonadaceae bacterium]
MRILVTGGTGVVGQSAVTALVKGGHEVRLFSRDADKDVLAWPSGVHAYPGSVSEPHEVLGSADQCDAVLHIAGIAAESPPHSTYEKVNVEGTRNMVGEAERAEVGLFLYVSSLGADRGSSPYHKSKLQAENLVQRFQKHWVILRPGNVYGPGDEVISKLLKMIRTLPALPVLNNGEQAFQPIWAGDLGKALAMAVERTDLAGRVLDLAGNERTCTNDVLDQLQEITGRKPVRIPVPSMLANLGTKLASMAGVELPVNDSQITMLDEGNVIAATRDNALTTVFGIEPTPLETGLRLLADALPEQLPSDGVGSFERKRYWADIRSAHHTPESLFTVFRENMNVLTPELLELSAEPGRDALPMHEGSVLTMRLPLRGHIQVRVEELTEKSMTLATLQGHPLAGIIRFFTAKEAGSLRFEVRVYGKAANMVDWITMHSVGGRIQNATWVETVENVVRASRGLSAQGVQQEKISLDDRGQEQVENWIQKLIDERICDERSDGIEPGAEANEAVAV